MAGELAKYATSPIEPADASSGFRSGTHPLDDYFRRHAAANDVGEVAASDPANLAASG